MVVTCHVIFLDPRKVVNTDEVGRCLNESSSFSKIIMSDKITKQKFYILLAGITVREDSVLMFYLF